MSAMAVPPRTAPRIEHATLLAAVAVGSAAVMQARREACRRIAAQVYRVVAAVLGPSSPDAGDASQEAFMRVYNAIGSFVFDADRPHGPTKWVNQIALRVALDRLRDRRRHGGDDLDLERIEIEAPGDPDDAIDKKQLVAALLERLNEKERAVLVLKYWSDETDEEIAATLGLPLGTVKTRLRAAGAKLRQSADGGERARLVTAEVKA
jgi:RNA polymerase sigma-70 factor, ECF subfamily